MKLLFEEITGKTKRYTLMTAVGSQMGMRIVSLDATANISVSRRDSETVILQGKLKANGLFVHRCGEQVKENLYCEFEYLVTTGKEQALDLRDFECSDEDAITLYLKEPEIDVDEILREQTYLAFPLRTLCSEDCKGICAGCGVNLNKGDCCCSSDKSTSAFAVLKKLTNH